VASGTDDGRVIIWAIDDERSLAELIGPDKPVAESWFSQGGRYLAVRHVDADGQWLVVWDVPNQRRVLEVLDNSYVSEGVCFDQGGDEATWVALATDDGNIRIHDLETGEVRASLPFDDQHIALSHDRVGDRIAVASYDTQTLAIWDLSTGTLERRVDLPSKMHRIAWRPNGAHLACAADDGTLYLLDGATAGVDMKLLGHQAAVVQVYWLRGTDLLLTTGWDATSRVWSASSGQEILGPIDRWGIVGASDRVVTSSHIDGEIGIWSFQYSDAYAVLGDDGMLQGHTQLALHPDGEHVLTCSTNYGVHLWGLENAQSRGTLIATPMHDLRLLPDGETIITATVSQVDRWRLELDPPVAHHERVLWQGERLRGMTTDLAGERVALTSHGGFEILDVEDGTRVFHGEWYQGMAGVPSLTPDGRYAFTGNWRGEPGRIWNLETSEIEGRYGAPHTIGSFSTDGAHLVVVREGALKILRTGDWSEVATIDQDYQGDLAHRPFFTSDGAYMAILDSLTSIMLVEVATGRRLTSMASPWRLSPKGMEFSADDRHLVVGTTRAPIEVWDLQYIRDMLGDMKLDWKP
jgi:WD40 repeat protein